MPVEREFTMELEKSTTYEHYTKYANMLKELGLGITDKENFFGMTKDFLIGKFKEDAYLNNVPLKKWDAMWISFSVYHQKLALGKSLAEGVCVYKHLCIYHFLEVTPVFTK